MPLTFGREVVDEGDIAQLSCLAMKGDEPLTISWTFHGQGISSDLGIITTPIGSRGSMLVITSVGRDHNGNYTCSAKNDAGAISETAVLKVNGRIDSQEGTHYHLSFLTSRTMPFPCFRTASFNAYHVWERGCR